MAIDINGKLPFIELEVWRDLEVGLNVGLMLHCVAGNRPLEAVLQALTQTLRCASTGNLPSQSVWELPRLVVVKSEELHSAISGDGDPSW